MIVVLKQLNQIFTSLPT